MRVLGIDTSTKTTAVGLVEDGRTIAEYNLTGLTFHSESVTNMIEEIFKKFDFKLSDIDLIAVGIGPGSFTGLRIGITIAKVLAFTLQKDIVGVSSLVANSMRDSGVVAALADAKRNKLYASIVNNENQLEMLMEDEIISVEDFKNILSKYESIILTGIDAPNFIDNFENAKLSLNLEMSGASVAKLGIIEYEKRGADNAFSIVPNYLKLSQAEKQYEKNKNS